jgi:hypothetical protein
MDERLVQYGGRDVLDIRLGLILGGHCLWGDFFDD